jgi:DNA modification methylase
MEAITINSRIIKTELIKWRDLEFIQQENFKEWINDGDTKLIESILKYQFCDAFKVWEHDGKLFCLDGKHRFLDLIKVSELGHNVPEELPATFVDCESMESAAELVLVYSSQYAKITQQGLFDFVSKFNLDIPILNAVINIPEFSMQRFEQKFDLFQVETGEEPHVEVDEKNIIVKSGDVFQLNGHRLICGSFTSEDDVKALMQDDKARIVNCDPPYNLPANFFTNKDEHRHKDFAMGAGEMTDEEFVQFLSLIMTTSVANSVPGAIHYIFMDFRHSWHMTEAARRVYGNPQPKQVCVWKKDLFANGSFYRAQQELCFVFSDEKAKALWQKDLLDEGGEFYKDNNEWCFIFKNGEAAKHLSHLELKNRIRSNVWEYPSATSMANPDRFELKNHPTPKPVIMIADSILDTTNENDIVIDWFLGSGTCLIACEHTNRRGRFTEIEPMYVQSAIQRYINYCNKRSIDVIFTHLNGNLTLNEFANEPKH